MSLKNLGRKIYQCIPDGVFRRHAAAWVYRRLHGDALADCCVVSGTFIVQTRDGVVVGSVVDFDPESLTADFTAVPKAGVVMDVGGNIGAVAIYLAAKVGPAGQIIAYEPDERNLALFRRNLKANGSPAQVQLVPKGISDREGTLEFYSGGNYTSSFQKTDYIQRKVEKYNVVRIPVTTLDAEAARLNLTRLDFVKMDIEGSEVSALQGAHATLQRFHPPIIVETHIVNGQSTAAEVEKLLAQFGYRNIVRQTLAETPGIRATLA